MIDKDQIKKSIKQGLRHLIRGKRLTATEWADEHFYMSSESSYIEGKWTTVPNQVAILNAMGNDKIKEVNWIKSARVGYTKLICAVIGYFIEHKKRNVAAWQPDDGARDKFSKKHIDNMIRDVKPLRKLFPWFGTKHKNNTMEGKSFANRKELHLLGGKAAKNFREISVDVVITDEISKFDRDIEGEGSPVLLADKRTEGSAFRKSIRGSSPAILGECLITEVSQEAEHHFKRHIPCPCCGTFQTLKFGTPKSPYGLKWGKNLPENKNHESVMYQCESCHDYFSYSQFIKADHMGYWESDEGLLTYDSYTFYDSDDMRVMKTPENVSFHLWTIYSHFSHWKSIVKEWNRVKKNPNRLKTFVNTTLGEAFEDDADSKVDENVLYARREKYAAQVPANAYYLTAGYDMQDNRVEGAIYAWGENFEKFLVDSFIVFGNPKQLELWDQLELITRRKYQHETGVLLPISRICFDSGGHHTDEVHKFSRRMGVEWVLPCKGSSTHNQPVATMPKVKDRSRGTYLVSVGTDTAKDEIFSSFNIELEDDVDMTQPLPGWTHFPKNDLICNKLWFEQLCAETKGFKLVGRKRVRVWKVRYEGIRNEALDNTVYATAAFYCSLQYFGLNIEQLKQSFVNIRENKPNLKPKKKSKAGMVTGGV